MSENEKDELVEAKIPPEQVVDLFSGIDELDLTDEQRTQLRDALIAVASDPEHARLIRVRPPRKPEPPVTYQLGCLRCGRDLEPICEGSRDAWGGTTFSSRGSYGSTVFDRDLYTVDELEAIVCDDCLRKVARDHPHLIRGLKHARHLPARRRTEVVPWAPREPESGED